MNIREMVIAELANAELRVPELCEALRKRSDIRWWQRLYLWGNGALYNDMRRLEDSGLVESVRFESRGLQLTRWRLPSRGGAT